MRPVILTALPAAVLLFLGLPLSAEDPPANPQTPPAQEERPVRVIEPNRFDPGRTVDDFIALRRLETPEGPAQFNAALQRLLRDDPQSAQLVLERLTQDLARAREPLAGADLEKFNLLQQMLTVQEELAAVQAPAGPEQVPGAVRSARRPPGETPIDLVAEPTQKAVGLSLTRNRRALGSMREDDGIAGILASAGGVGPGATLSPRLPRIQHSIRSLSDAPPEPTGLPAPMRIPRLDAEVRPVRVDPARDPFGRLGRRSDPFARFREFSPARLPPMQTGQAMGDYLAALPLQPLQRYQRWLQENPGGDLPRPTERDRLLIRSQLAQVNSALRGREERLGSVLALADEPGSREFHGAFAALPAQERRDFYRVLEHLDQAADDSARARGVLPVFLPYTSARQALWRAELDRGVSDHDRERFGAPSSWLNLSPSEMTERLAQVTADGRKIGDVLAFVRNQHYRALSGLGAGQEANGVVFNSMGRFESDLYSRYSAEITPRVREFNERFAQLTAATRDPAAAAESLTAFRAEIRSYLTGLDPRFNRPPVSSQREQLLSTLGRIDPAAARLRETAAFQGGARPVAYIQGETLDPIQSYVRHPSDILGGRMLLLTDSRAGAAGVSHQHVILEMRYRDAEGRERTVNYPFGFFRDAANERRSFDAGGEHLSTSREHQLRGPDALAAYNSMVRSQAVFNHGFQTGSFHYSLLGQGGDTSVSGWSYATAGLSWLVPQTIATVGQQFGGGTPMNCRDVACIVMDQADGALRAGR